MKHPRTYLKCEHCGKIVGVIEEVGPELICCGEAMKKLEANTTDAATEKHVPVVVRDGNTITVTVGSVPHPMTEEHHISWISVAQDNKTERAMLSHTGSPTATFNIDDGDATVYEYCNLHGLWAVDI